MDLSELAKLYFQFLESSLGAVDRPIRQTVFPFDAGGALNFLTIGLGKEQFVTHISWDLFGHPEVKRGSGGRFEFITTCDDEEWCRHVITKIGRYCQEALVEVGDSMDIEFFVSPDAPIQGVVFQNELITELGDSYEKCSLIRCIGITRDELEYSRRTSVQKLVEELRRVGVYSRTSIRRKSIPLP